MAAKPLVATGAPAAKTAAKTCCTFSGKALEETLKALPHGYGCVVTVGLAGVFVNVWMAKQVLLLDRVLKFELHLYYFLFTGWECSKRVEREISLNVFAGKQL